MAKKYLTGDGNWSTAGNWKPVASAPIANDEVVIGPILTNDVTDSAVAADNLDFNSVLVHRLFKKSFGSTGTPMQIAADLVKLYSGGPVFLNADSGGTGLKIDHLFGVLASPSLVGEIGADAAQAGTIDNITLNRGNWTLKSSIVFGTGAVSVGFVNNPSGDCQVSIDTTAPTLALLLVNGGVVRPNNTVTAMHVANALVVKTLKAATTTYIYAGGVVNYEFENTGTNEDVHIYPGGTLDLMTNGLPKAFGNVFVHPGATLRYDPSIHTFGGTFGLVDTTKEVF